MRRKDPLDWYGKFIAPRSVDEDERRRERILNIILLSLTVMVMVLDGIVLYYSLLQGSSYHEVSFAAFSIIPAFFLFLYALSRRVSFILASYLLIAAYFVSDSYAAYRWGVDLPAALLGYALLIVIASILVSSHFGFFVASLVSFFIIVLWYFQFYAIVPIPQQPTQNSSDALVFAVLFFLLSILAWLSNSEIEKSLVRARTSERKLKEERDHLEITVDERTRELRRAQFEKVENIYRLAAFGDLASGLFHNLINMFMSLLPTGKRDEDVIVLSKKIKNFAESMRRQLQDEDIEQLFSLNDAIDYAVQLLEYKANKAMVKILLRKGEDIAFYGNRFQFHNIVVNLIANAIESYRELAPNDPGRPRTVRIRVIASGGRIVLSVADNGCGISEEKRGKIFEPFFTSKEGAGGMGIGLSIVKKIVEQDLRGRIAVTSAAGKGSRFILDFPYAKKSFSGNQ